MRLRTAFALATNSGLVAQTTEGGWRLTDFSPHDPALCMDVPLPCHCIRVKE